MNEPNAIRDIDQAEPVVRQFDLDDGYDPWTDWDDIGGQG